MTCSGAWPIGPNRCAEARGLNKTVRLPLLIAYHPLNRNELITIYQSYAPANWSVLWLQQNVRCAIWPDAYKLSVPSSRI